MKTPPSAIDLEKNVIGAILIEKDAIIDIAESLRPEMFYDEKHQIIFRHCIKLFIENSPIDISIVAESLRRSNELEKVGGPFGLTELTDTVVSSANIVYHTLIIKQKYIAREEIKNSQKIIEACYDPAKDVFEIMGEAYVRRDELMQQIFNKTEKSFSTLVQETVKGIQTNQSAPNKELNGIRSGFDLVDKITGGWQKTDLIILAARPAMGKTSNALTMAINAAKNGHSVGFFSLEMSEMQITKKAISICTDISFKSVKNDNLNTEDWSVLNTSFDDISSLPIHIDDTAGMTITEIVTKAKRMKHKYNIEFIIIDYLQLIESSGQSRNQTRDQVVGYHSRTLKALAKELDLPVLALSQLNRAVDTRPDHKPVLSDLRESGSIEQDADIVVFITRPEYYGKTETEIGDSTDGLAYFIIAKHRNGSTDEIHLRFNKRTTGFTDYHDSNDNDFLPLARASQNRTSRNNDLNHLQDIF